MSAMALSPQTRSRDHVKKLNVYMEGGVREYWIIDSKKLKVIQHYFEGKELIETITYTHPDIVKSIYFESLVIATADIFAE